MSRGSTPEADSKRNTTSPPSVATQPKSPKSLTESQVATTLVKPQSMPQEKEELKTEVEKPENENDKNITKGKILLYHDQT